MGSSRSRRAPSRSLRPRPSCPVARLPGLSVAPATWSLSQAQVCREYCREGICRERCYNTREDGDVTVGIGRQRTFDRDRDRRDFDRDRDRDRDLDASATRTENTYRVSLSALLCARGERPRRRAAERDQQFPPSEGDCHTPLPCEVRKGNDITPRACSLDVQGGQDAGCFESLSRASGSEAEKHDPGAPLK